MILNVPTLCRIFGILRLYNYTKNVSQLLLVHSGYHTHTIQYTQKAHVLRERFAIFSE